jgi:hypothetical protein
MWFKVRHGDLRRRPIGDGLVGHFVVAHRGVAGGTTCGLRPAGHFPCAGMRHAVAAGVRLGRVHALVHCRRAGTGVMAVTHLIRGKCGGGGECDSEGRGDRRQRFDAKGH